MDNIWSVSLNPSDDMLLRSGDFDGDMTFKVYLYSKLDDIEQEFRFHVPKQSIESYTRTEKMTLFNKAIDIVQAYVGTDLLNNEQTDYVLENGSFSPRLKPRDDLFTFPKPEFQ